MSQVYVCPECAGHWQRKQYKRIKRWSGDTVECWPNPCWLCNEGYVTLDQIVERATDPLLYFERLFAPKAVMSAAMVAEADKIPF